MRLPLLNIFLAATIILSCSLLVSCNKVNVSFGNIDQNGDPDVTYYQNYQVSLQTLQLDSFLTSSQNIYTIGYNNDPLFGTIHAGSYVQFQTPPVNPLLNAQFLSFDSLELVIKSKANYYGDTTKPFYFKIYQLTEPIQNTTVANDNYYNTRSFGYNTSTSLDTLGRYIIDTPSISSYKSIRLSDALGSDLFNKLVAGSTTITNQADFLNYFEGIYMDVDTNKTNIVYAFSDTLTMRLHYTLHGLTTVEKTLDFPTVSGKQFNHIAYNRAGTLPAFPASINNVATLNSSATHNKAYLNPTTGAYIKISFPDLLNLKTLHPYVKVVSAQLIIPPSPGTYNYPYKLPPILYLYETSNANTLLTSVLNGNGVSETGDLFIDNLYGQTTQYTYDITNFVTELLNPPVNPTASTPNALILGSGPTLGDESLSRLIINDQDLPKGIQLKLYVLGI